MNYYLMLYWQLMWKKKNTFISSFTSCSFWNVFCSRKGKSCPWLHSDSSPYSHLCYSWKSCPQVGLDSFQFLHHLCHYGLVMCRVLLVEPLKHYFLVRFDYYHRSLIQIFQDLQKKFFNKVLRVVA